VRNWQTGICVEIHSCDCVSCDCSGWKTSSAPDELQVHGSLFISEALQDSPEVLDELIRSATVLFLFKLM